METENKRDTHKNSDQQGKEREKKRNNGMWKCEVRPTKWKKRREERSADWMTRRSMR